MASLSPEELVAAASEDTYGRTSSLLVPIQFLLATTHFLLPRYVVAPLLCLRSLPLPGDFID